MVLSNRRGSRFDPRRPEGLLPALSSILVEPIVPVPRVVVVLVVDSGLVAMMLLQAAPDVPVEECAVLVKS